MSVPPDPGWLPPRPPQDHTGLVVGMTFAGLAIYSLINVVAFFAAVTTLDAAGVTAIVLFAVGLALFALGGGTVLLLLRRPWAKGLGLGLMIGWAVWSIFSAGICTGLNPTIYS